MEAGVKTTQLAALEILLVLLLAGCVNLPMDGACRAGIEKESEVLYAIDQKMRHRRSTGFYLFVSAPESSELVGDWNSCLENLKMARSFRHGDTVPGRNSYAATDTAPAPVWHKRSKMRPAAAYDAAHHDAGHSHHHGH